MSSDIEIARKANMEPIMDIGTKLDIPFKALRPFGHFKAKLSQTWLQNQSKKKNAKLILVTAINPTPAGEGKTTTSVGLNDGLNAGLDVGMMATVRRGDLEVASVLIVASEKLRSAAMILELTNDQSIEVGDIVKLKTTRLS